MMKRSSRSYLDWRIWLAYALLFTIGVPWYWPADDARTLLGMPLWATVAMIVSVCLSILTAWLYLCYWPGADDADSGSDTDTEL